MLRINAEPGFFTEIFTELKGCGISTSIENQLNNNHLISPSSHITNNLLSNTMNNLSISSSSHNTNNLNNNISIGSNNNNNKGSTNVNIVSPTTAMNNLNSLNNNHLSQSNGNLQYGSAWRKHPHVVVHMIAGANQTNLYQHQTLLQELTTIV